MAKTDAVNPNRPLETGESPRLGDDVIRTLARAVAELIGVDHRIGADGGSGYTEDAAGEHNRVKFYAPISTPSSAANKGYLYMKDVSGKGELFWLDEDGDELQLTSGGVLNPVIACGLTGNQTIAGIKTFSSIPVLPGSNPTAGNQAARKTYVDAQITAQVPVAIRPKGWVAFDGTATILSSYNVASVTRNAVGKFTVAWDTDMSDGNYAVIASAGETQIAGPRNGTVAAGTVDIWVHTSAGVLADPSPSCSVLGFDA